MKNQNLKMTNDDVNPNAGVVEVVCTTCDNKIAIKSTAKDIKVDSCSNCHPFYTGKQTSGSAAGRIEKFNKKYNRNK